MSNVNLVYPPSKEAQGTDTDPIGELSGSRAVDLAAAVEAVIVETSRAIDQIRAGIDLLGSSVLRLASIVALQAKEQR